MVQQQQKTAPRYKNGTPTLKTAGYKDETAWQPRTPYSGLPFIALDKAESESGALAATGQNPGWGLDRSL